MSAFLTIALIHQLAVMSPGPDFAITVRNSLRYSRRTGITTALGIALGILIHVAYSLLGIGFIISQSILLFNVIKLLGASYLLYIGWKALTSHEEKREHQTIRQNQPRTLPTFQALKMGFLCNLLNPKVTIFFFSIFTQLVDPSTPFLLQCFYGIYISLSTFTWFSFVALVLTHGSIRELFTKAQHTIERVMGAILIALGIKVALATQES